MENTKTLEQRGQSRGWRLFKPYVPSIVAIIALMIAGNVITPGFISPLSITNILTVSGFLALVAVSQNLVIISGNAGIDLSVGAMVSMGALLGPSLSGGSNVGIIVACLALAGLAAMFGLVSGVGTRVLGINSLVMTLVMERVVNGFVYGITRGQPSYNTPEALLAVGKPVFQSAPQVPLRVATLVAIIALLFLAWLLHKSRYGQKIFLYGTNATAAKLSGLHTTRLGVSVYIVSAIVATLTGFLLVGYVGTGQVKMGASYTMSSIAAVVIGGTSLAGGKGTVLGGVLGAVTLTILTNLLTAAGLNDGVRQMIQGIVLIGILIINEKILANARRV